MSDYEKIEYWIQGRTNEGAVWQNIHTSDQRPISYFNSSDEAKATLVELLSGDKYTSWGKLRIVRRTITDEVICSPVNIEETDAPDISNT